MTPRTRPARPPRRVIGCWAVAAVFGAAVIVATSGTTKAQPQGLGPSTLATYLARAAGNNVHDIRVNGVYGSAHSGAWQFVAHLTWHDSAGAVHGGTTNLPTLADAPTLASPFGTARLTSEEKIGWPLPTLSSVLSHVPDDDAALALIELQITPAAATLVACAAAAGHIGVCNQFDDSGRAKRQFDASLVDDPLAGALAIRRENEG